MESDLHSDSFIQNTRLDIRVASTRTRVLTNNQDTLSIRSPLTDLLNTDTEKNIFKNARAVSEHYTHQHYASDNLNNNNNKNKQKQGKQKLNLAKQL